jgi:uncharacterized protein YoxC
MNVLVAVSLMFLAVTLSLLVGFAAPLFIQAGRTLNAYEKLADTLETEVKPTLIEVRHVVDGLNDLRSLTSARVTAVSHRVEDVAGTVSTVAGEAKKHSNVWGTGLLAGVRAYLNGQSPDIQPSTRQIPASQGEKNV